MRPLQVKRELGLHIRPIEESWIDQAVTCLQLGLISSPPAPNQVAQH